MASSEIYTSAAYGYGRFEARLKFAAGDGVVSSFFLWKDGSEVSGTFWNELDFEKVGADCHVETNAIHGNPVMNHSKSHPALVDPCGTYHTYTYEWTPDAIVWLVDGTEIRRETGAIAAAYAQNATAMQLRFNVWPGDATFGGNFSPNILPVHQYVDWVQYSAYENGTFVMKWREDFDAAAVPSGWLTASWLSPKNLSTHDARNVNFIDGHLTLSLTADNATGPAGAMHGDTPSGGRAGGGAAGSASSGSPGQGGTAGRAGGAGGAPSAGASNPAGGSSSPAGGTASPAGGTASPAGGAVSPAGGTASPAGGTAGPTGGTTNPTGGAVNPTGGTNTGGVTSAMGGATGGATGPAAGGSPGAAPTAPPASDSGCSWRATGPQGAAAPLGAIGAAALMLMRRLRVRRTKN